MDRLARNLDDLRLIVQKLTKRGVRIEFVKENLTFTGENSPLANLMLSIMGAFAEFERALIRERQREGIALAKQRGAWHCCSRPAEQPNKAPSLDVAILAFVVLAAPTDVLADGRVDLRAGQQYVRPHRAPSGGCRTRRTPPPTYRRRYGGSAWRGQPR